LTFVNYHLLSPDTSPDKKPGVITSGFFIEFRRFAEIYLKAMEGEIPPMALGLMIIKERCIGIRVLCRIESRPGRGTKIPIEVTL